jgi:hypothetical protein
MHPALPFLHTLFTFEPFGVFHLVDNGNVRAGFFGHNRNLTNNQALTNSHFDLGD